MLRQLTRAYNPKRLRSSSVIAQLLSVDTTSPSSGKDIPKNGSFIGDASPSSENSGPYYKEFMKLWRQQREVPFVFKAVKSKIGTTGDSIRKPYRYVVFQEDDEKLPAHVKQSQEINPFVALGVKAETVMLLQENGIAAPLPVQIKALPHILCNKKVILESETGSGKTLTYLIPIMQDMGTMPCGNIIIAPTRELATQIYNEALKYLQDKSLVCRLVSGVDDSMLPNLTNTLRSCKVLVATPNKLLEILESHSGYFRNVKRIVIDECDKLLPFISPSDKQRQNVRLNNPRPTEKILAMLTSFRKSTQLIACSATIEHGLVQDLQDYGWGRGSVVIRTKSDANLRFGQVPQSIKHQYIVVPDAETDFSIKACAKLFRGWGLSKALVFIRSSESVEKSVAAFKEIGLESVALYKELIHPGHVKFEQFVAKFKSGETQLVVANEETVRGLDFPFLENVFLLYVPDTPIAYLHLAGRVGRLGKAGTVTTIIGESKSAVEKKHLKRRYFLLNIKGTLISLV